MNYKRWESYYAIRKKNATPRKTILDAISILTKSNLTEQQKFAIDLGCGSGSDTLALLEQGWSVFAIDSNPFAITNLVSSCPAVLANKLNTAVQFFEDLTKLPKANLINSSFSLPFTHPNCFEKLWDVIMRSIAIDGIFSGSFFGTNDDWYRTNNETMTFLTDDKIYDLFKTFDIELFEEVECDEADAFGNLKHWHKYSIIAKCKYTQKT
jgi:SAM-dependent methyltransferase